jgi:hypothetical protein
MVSMHNVQERMVLYIQGSVARACSDGCVFCGGGEFH